MSLTKYLFHQDLACDPLNTPPPLALFFELDEVYSPMPFMDSHDLSQLP